MGLAAAASAAGVSLRTARKWLARYEAAGEGGLVDRSCRPLRTRNSIDAELAERIEGMRLRRIATIVGRSVASLGLSSLSALEPAKPVLRYEHEAPGELLHIDTKKLGRIVRPSHRVTGDRRDSVEGAGWEFAHVAISTVTVGTSALRGTNSARNRARSGNSPISSRSSSSRASTASTPSSAAMPNRATTVWQAWRWVSLSSSCSQVRR